MLGLALRFLGFIATSVPIIWRWVGPVLNSRWAWLVAWAGLTYTASQHTNTVLGWTTGYFDAWAKPNLAVGSSGTLTYAMSLANTFMPLEELFAFLVSFAAMIGALNVYKFSRSLVSNAGVIKPK